MSIFSSLKMDEAALLAASAFFQSCRDRRLSTSSAASSTAASAFSPSAASASGAASVASAAPALASASAEPQLWPPAPPLEAPFATPLRRSSLAASLSLCLPAAWESLSGLQLGVVHRDSVLVQQTKHGGACCGGDSISKSSINTPKIPIAVTKHYVALTGSRAWQVLRRSQRCARRWPLALRWQGARSWLQHRKRT